MVTHVEEWFGGKQPGDGQAHGDRVLVVSASDGLVSRRVRVRDRLVARVRACGLDQRLCRGEPPESSVPLALRAVHLVGTGSRGGLARTVRHLLDLTGQPRWSSHVPVCYRNVRAAVRELEALHVRLEAPGPVSAYGIARLRALLTDGGGPLYHGSNRDDLADRLRDVL
ncbi:MAG TPA: hypothetical protein VH008_00745, partial [Pseudonocardia sp.]|nr:hypothetical protein [Pseudonocardia sp.]